MIRKELKRGIRELIADELEAAGRTHPEFASAHEGYAVLLEEAQEAGEELDAINDAMESIWDCIRGDFSVAGSEHVREIRAHAENLAAEAIQVAAMVEKFERSAKNWRI